MDIYYVDGDFVPADRAVIPVNDLAVLRGLGAFELLRTYGGRPFALEEHLQRLAQSVGKIGLPLPGDLDHIRQVVLETLARNQRPEEVNIRIIVTGGSSPDFMTHQGQPRLLVLVSEMPRQPGEWYVDGVKITTMQSRRILPGAKSINYLSATIALQKARAKDAVESAYVDRDGLVYECTTSNIFAFFGDRLVTPGRRILAGITRGAVLNMAEALFTVEVRDLPFKEFVAADEIFITGTNKGIVPVVRVDDTVVADGRPGPRTRRLMAALEAHTQDHGQPQGAGS
ncbi:MAG: aminotransferase class IV [Desulfobacterales bacterium]|nr:aminotransferase class IV [Desulfobacterales bacterium]